MACYRDVFLLPLWSCKKSFLRSQPTWQRGCTAFPNPLPEHTYTHIYTHKCTHTQHVNLLGTPPGKLNSTAWPTGPQNSTSLASLTSPISCLLLPCPRDQPDRAAPTPWPHQAVSCFQAFVPVFLLSSLGWDEEIQPLGNDIYPEASTELCRSPTAMHTQF